MSDQNISWEELLPSIERTEESYFQEWAALEDKFGELGPPGFTEQTMPVRFPTIIGHDGYVDVRFTLFRNQDNQLICVHGCYIDNGVQKPFVWDVHPDHQRQGIGTMMANYVLARYTDEYQKEFTYEESLRDVTYTTPSANFANKYVRNVFSQQENQ